MKFLTSVLGAIPAGGGEEHAAFTSSDNIRNIDSYSVQGEVGGRRAVFSAYLYLCPGMVWVLLFKHRDKFIVMNLLTGRIHECHVTV